MELEAEVVGLLTKLLQADTSNPPGDVRPAVGVLQEYFTSNGVEPVLVGESPELANVVVRLPGAGDGPTLVMLGHTDVVPVTDAGEWREPPFSGHVRDGYVWGRGALDMKNQVAAQAVALVRLARRAADGQGLRGDLTFVAVADEETGDHSGAKWLLENHPDLVRGDFLVNEGGFEMFEVGGRRLYTVSNGEKGYANCRFTVRGRGGHGSMPQHEESVAHGLAEIVLAIEEHEPPVVSDHLPVDFIDRVVGDAGLRARLKGPGSARAALRELAAADKSAAGIIEPLLGLTFATTGLRAGGAAVNVIPPSAEAAVDCRTLPGQTADDVRREVERALARVSASWELEFAGVVPGNASPADSPLAAAIAETMAELVPGADVICQLMSGFTDSSHFRHAFPDIVAYGFAPFVVEDGAAIRPRFHGIDERIHVRDLVLQTRYAEKVAERLLA